MIDLKFFQYLKGRCHGNQFCVVEDMFARSRISQYPLDRFSQSLHHMVGVGLQMISPTFFFGYLKGRCHDDQLSGKNGAKLPPHMHSSLCHSNTEWAIAI